MGVDQVRRTDPAFCIGAIAASCGRRASGLPVVWMGIHRRAPAVATPKSLANAVAAEPGGVVTPLPIRLPASWLAPPDVRWAGNCIPGPVVDCRRPWRRSHLAAPGWFSGVAPREPGQIRRSAPHPDSRAVQKSLFKNRAYEFRNRAHEDFQGLTGDIIRYFYFPAAVGGHDPASIATDVLIGENLGVDRHLLPTWMLTWFRSLTLVLLLSLSPTKAFRPAFQVVGRTEDGGLPRGSWRRAPVDSCTAIRNETAT